MEGKVKPLLEEDIRREVKEKYAARASLKSHLTAFLLTNGMMWIIWLFFSGGSPWPLFLTPFWGIGMVIHYLSYHNEYGAGAEKRAAEIEEEVARQRRLAQLRAEESRQRLYDDDEIVSAAVYDLDNVKRSGLRLSDEGELTGSFIAEAAQIPDDDRQKSRN